MDLSERDAHVRADDRVGPDFDRAVELRLRIDDALRIPVGSAGLTMISGGSVGIAVFDTEFGSPRDFVRRADALLYAAKHRRRDRRHLRIRSDAT